MKKLSTSLVLSLLLALCLAVLPIGAEEAVVWEVPEAGYYLAPQTSIEDFKEVDTEAFKTVVRNGFDERKTEIDISSFGILKSDDRSIFSYIKEILPEYFHAEITNASYYSSSGKYAVLKVTYHLTAEEHEEALVVWDETVDEMVADLVGNSSLTDVQKALLIHDRIAVHCEYDYERLNNGTMPKISYTTGGVLVYGTAVCQGYAEAYRYLLDLVGIESYICTSDALFHAWNIVKLDGDYYYVDVTWDDPVWDRSGRVMHTNFLCSYEEFSKTHTATDYDQTPTNTQYDNAFWRDSNSSFEYVNDEIYYIDHAEQRIERYDGTEILSIEAVWYSTSTGYYYPGSFSCLDSYGDKLYYSQPKKIWSYDITTGANTVEFTPEHSFADGNKEFNIYGFRISDGKYVCEIYSAPNFDVNTKKNYTVTGKMAISVTGVTLNKTAMSLEVGETGTLTATVLPDNATNKAVTWTSSNTTVATVSADGKVTAKAAGTATITVKTADGNKTATCTVTVNPATVSVTGVFLNFANKTITVGESFTLTATVLPDNATNKAVTWTSSDESVATVSADGTVTAKAAGTVTITVTTADGNKTATCTVTVTKAENIVFSGKCGENLTWKLDDEGKLTISGNGEMYDYEYTSDIPWYSHLESIKTLVIEDGVTSIGNWAFEDCFNLTSMTIGNGVTSIGLHAFYSCDSLTSVNIPESVTDLGRYAFSGCDSLVRISVAANNPNYSSDEAGVLFNKDKTTIMQYPAGKTESVYSIPSGVTSIDYGAFGGSTYLTNVVIPNGVTSIGGWAFDDCPYLESVTLPGSVESIGNCAFRYCFSLESINIPSGVTSIFADAFEECYSLTGIWVDENNENYSSDEKGVLFSKDKTILIHYPIGRTETSYEIPNGVTSIEYNAFSRSELVSIKLPVSVTSIAYNAFSDCYYLANVYYYGTETQWNGITISDGNDFLSDANIRYNYDPYAVVAGDANGDGTIDIKDAVLIAQYLAGWTVSIGENAADCNGDGNVDIKDAVLLAQYLAGWNVTLG
jgi:uncharacterized protein YjdB